MSTQVPNTAWWVCKTAEIHPRDHSDLTFLVMVKVKGGSETVETAPSWLYNLILKDTSTNTCYTLQQMSCCVFRFVCCWRMHDCVKYTQIARASPDTHRHCCVVVVGPEIGSPHEGSVPWSSPWGASLSCTQICALYLGMKATAPALFKQSCVSSVLGLYFSRVSLSHLILCHSLPFLLHSP